MADSIAGPREAGLPVARIAFGLLLLTTALAQATFLPALGLLGVLPDFALIFLLIWSATHGATEGMYWAFGLGLWLDVLTMDALGAHGIGLLAVAAIGGAIRGRLFRSGAVLPVVAVVAATLAYSMIVMLVAGIAGERVDVVSAMRLALMIALLNALLVPLAYGLLLVFDRWIPRRV